MKKIITTFLMVGLLALMIPMMATDASAQRRYRNQQRYSERYSRRYERPGVYKRHRNLINIGIGAGAGALVGALLGGKKGALIGAAVGAGGAALYTYKLNPKTKRYERVYNNRRYRTRNY